jgi:hypothetical protein
MVAVEPCTQTAVAGAVPLADAASTRPALSSVTWRPSQASISVRTLASSGRLCPWCTFAMRWRVGHPQVRRDSACGEEVLKVLGPVGHASPQPAVGRADAGTPPVA